MDGIVTRQRAKDLGFPCYYTGEPCSRGHVAPRYVSSRNCTVCADEDHQRQLAEHPELRQKKAETARQWRKNNRDRRNEYNRNRDAKQRAEKKMGSEAAAPEPNSSSHQEPKGQRNNPLEPLA
jgi:hypothetical protein